MKRRLSPLVGTVVLAVALLALAFGMYLYLLPQTGGSIARTGVMIEKVFYHRRHRQVKTAHPTTGSAAGTTQPAGAAAEKSPAKGPETAGQPSASSGAGTTAAGTAGPQAPAGSAPGGTGGTGKPGSATDASTHQSP